jgi:hypothetical protein
MCDVSGFNGLIRLEAINPPPDCYRTVTAV